MERRLTYGDNLGLCGVVRTDVEIRIADGGRVGDELEPAFKVAGDVGDADHPVPELVLPLRSDASQRGIELLVVEDARRRSGPEGAVDEEGEVWCNAGVEMRAEAVRMLVVLLTVECVALAMGEVVLQLQLRSVDGVAGCAFADVSATSHPFAQGPRTRIFDDALEFRRRHPFCADLVEDGSRALADATSTGQADGQRAERGRGAVSLDLPAKLGQMAVKPLDTPCNVRPGQVLHVGSTSWNAWSRHG